MSSLRCHIVGILVALAVLIILQPAQARETLIPLRECPKAGPHQACLPFPFRLAQQARERTLRKRAHSEAVTKFYLIKGRLSGGDVLLFRLKVIQKYSMDDDANSDDPGVLPYRGRTARNRPVILTDRGPLEILTKEFDADFSPNMFVVDEKRWSVVARYATVFDPYLKASPSGMDVWIKANGACVSAPQRKPILLTTNKHGCDGDGKLVDAPGFFHAPGANLERLVQLLPELSYLSDGAANEDGDIIQRDNAYASVYRVRGTSYLVVSTGCDDCF